MALSEYSTRLLGAYAEQPFLMAPMAGVTDPAYRIMCRRRGANLAYSEMVSVAGLAYASNKTWRLVLPADEERQICVQLFGSKPDQFASAVAAVEDRVGDRLSLIDINMACPARKVVTKGEGSALMRTPELAEKIVEAAVGAAHVPVTVKIRKGFYAEDRNAATFAQMLEGAGAAAVAVHGRCATQLYTGQADWSVVDEVADAAAQDARERPLAERMAHDLHKQPREHTHAHRRQNDEQPPRAGKARPRRAVVVHAREPQQRRQQRLRLAERHRIHNEPFDGLIRRHAQNRCEGKADRLALCAPVKAEI